MNLLFRNINVFDGVSDHLVLNQDVGVRDGKIEFLRDSKESAESNFEVFDGRGMTLLPGLIDCHANIVGLITREQQFGVTPKTIASSVLRGVKEGENCIRHGVTTIRVDTAGHYGTYALRDAFHEGSFPGPHMVMPGRAICTTCGHGWNFGNHIADGPWEVRRAVREEIKEGADWIKLMVTGGAGTSTERMEDQQMCKAEIEAAVDEAHARGKKTFGHLSVDKAIRECVEAGMDSVEHGIYLKKDTAAFMAQKGTYLVPTLGVYRRLVVQGEKGLVPDYMYRKSLQVVERHTKSFHYAMEAGVKIAAGTDSGQDWFPLGSSLLREIEIMNEEGMSNAQALKAATANAAALLERDCIGTIEAGKNADILVVEGNPLEDIACIYNTRRVLKDGVDLVRIEK